VRNTFGYVDASGARLVSVSEALKLAGLVDFSGVPRETLEYARQRGQDVHGWIEGIALGLIDDEEPDERIAPYVSAFKGFLAGTGFQVTDAELEVVSKVYRFAGRIDLVGTIGDALWVLDAKATAAVPPEAAIQTAGYGIALREMRNTRYQRGVLHLTGEGRYHLVEHKRGREDEADFLACVRIAYWRMHHGLAGNLED
jgi:hypothetical protein